MRLQRHNGRWCLLAEGAAPHPDADVTVKIHGARLNSLAGKALRSKSGRAVAGPMIVDVNGPRKGGGQ